MTALLVSGVASLSACSTLPSIHTAPPPSGGGAPGIGPVSSTKASFLKISYGLAGQGQQSLTTEIAAFTGARTDWAAACAAPLPGATDDPAIVAYFNNTSGGIVALVSTAGQPLVFVAPAGSATTATAWCAKPSPYVAAT